MGRKKLIKALGKKVKNKRRSYKAKSKAAFDVRLAFPRKSYQRPVNRRDRDIAKSVLNIPFNNIAAFAISQNHIKNIVN